jgi:hypothetical protein
MVWLITAQIADRRTDERAFLLLLRGTVNGSSAVRGLHNRLGRCRDSACMKATSTLTIISIIEVGFLEYIEGTNPGQRPHLMAVCQPSVPAFAATALMEPAQITGDPATLTMMGGDRHAARPSTTMP